MKKETLTFDNVMKDLRRVADEKMANDRDWRLGRAVPIVLVAILVGFLLQSVFVGVVIACFSIPSFIEYGKEVKKYEARKRAILSVIDRGDVSVSVEVLSHLSEETIYEPHSRGLDDRHATKTVSFLYFMSGASWRILNYGHYQWSKDYRLSTRGLKNISVPGNEYFFISLQGHYEISYVYPCKFFEIDEKLGN